REGVREGREAVSAEGILELPPLTPGYHRITVTVGERSASGWIVAAPQRCWRPRAYAEEGSNDWGLAAQLYG
ncbi:hypothetical protein, partial [Klebsiella pneumoniae]